MSPKGTQSAGQVSDGEKSGLPARTAPPQPAAQRPVDSSIQKAPPNKAPARKPADNPPPNAAAGRGISPGGSNTESWHLSNFSFYLCGPGKSEVAYEVDSDEFRLVADAYHIGLQLFNREDSKSALVSLARSCAEAWTSPLNRNKYREYTWQGEKSKLGHYLDVFRRGITYTPPTIYNDPGLEPELYGVTVREPSYSMNYEKLLTRELFRISINSQLVSNIKDAFRKHEEDRYQELRMVLAVTFFHELTHGFVNFLIGDIGKASVRTPPDCSAIWEDVATVLNGESGFFVEGEVAGGSLEIRPFPSDKNKRGMLVARCEDDVLHKVTIDVVKGLLKAPKSFNIKKGIADGDIINLVQRPAKRQKTSHDINLRPRTRQDAWNIRFRYNADNTPIGLVKEKWIVAPAA